MKNFEKVSNLPVPWKLPFQLIHHDGGLIPGTDLDQALRFREVVGKARLALLFGQSGFGSPESLADSLIGGRQFGGLPGNAVGPCQIAGPERSLGIGKQPRHLPGLLQGGLGLLDPGL